MQTVFLKRGTVQVIATVIQPLLFRFKNTILYISIDQHYATFRRSAKYQCECLRNFTNTAQLNVYEVDTAFKQQAFDIQLSQQKSIYLALN